VMRPMAIPCATSRRTNIVWHKFPAAAYDSKGAAAEAPLQESTVRSWSRALPRTDPDRALAAVGGALDP
jgi:hypothetical protein